MECPKCGKKLRKSKTKEGRFLCDNCRKGYWDYELEDDYEDDYDDDLSSKPKKKKKFKALKITGIVILAIIVLSAIGSALGGSGDTKDSNQAKTDTQSASVDTAPKGEEQTSEAENSQPDAPTEYKSALSQAESYSEIMHMSKQGIYDQLVSEYGGQFSAEAAQYAVDNLQADYKANALEKAKQYQESMAMSPEAIREQLTSEYGERFTQEEADYAVENLP